MINRRFFPFSEKAANALKKCGDFWIVETSRMLKNGRLRIMLQGHFRATNRRRVAISVDIPLVSIESGNSVQMIKRCYWDVKHFDEGLRWFGLTLPIPVERRQEPFLMPLTSFGSA